MLQMPGYVPQLHAVLLFYIQATPPHVPEAARKISSLFAVLWAYNHTSYNRPAGFTQPGHPTVAHLSPLHSPGEEPSTSGGVSRKPPYALTLANRLFPGTDEGRASDLLDLFSEIFGKCCVVFLTCVKNLQIGKNSRACTNRKNSDSS